MFLKIRSFFKTYAARLSHFHPNARLYLTYAVFIGAAMGIFRLLFNFYALSLGFDEALLGQFVTTNNLTSLLVILPIGYLADRLGRKRSLLISGMLTALAIAAMVAWPQAPTLYLMNVIFGIAQSLAGVTMSPFLMENSHAEERTYLFSIGQGLQMVSSSLGNWIGGYLPGWVGGVLLVSAVSSQAYGISLLIVSVAAAASLLPLFWLRTNRLPMSERARFDPLGYARSNGALLARLIAPSLVTAIGAGLIMPFMNVFFRQVHHLPDPVIGSLFAWGSLSMGIGLLIAPPLAERFGRIQLVVVTQALSIPFLILLGFSPWLWLATAAYYIRVALMNMSGPVYQTFVMEHVEPSGRATVASLVNMAGNFGWAFSPSVSGWLQVRYGFGAAFAGTIGLYIISTALYWWFFWRGATAAKPAVSNTNPALRSQA